ncbi:MAG: thioredoxin-disulfide reductase [Clostridia bacterium]|nr:thioredoxin-disulfide reductase [Clostridia bacterium]
MKTVDILVIGAGPAGMTAGLYAARSGREVAMVEKALPGGQMGTAHWIENYPGFPDGIGGAELAMQMQQQAEKAGVRVVYQAVQSLARQKEGFLVTPGGKDEPFLARTVILALGGQPRPLGVEGEDRLRGRGVSYCAACDGAFFRGKKTVVVGGGETAAADTLFLAGLCARVTLVHRRDTLRCTPVMAERVKSEEKIAMCWDSTVTALHEENGKLCGVTVQNRKTGETQILPTDGLFIAVGHTPDTALCRGLCALDEGGYILTDERMHTDVPGLFAAGDCRKKNLRQISTAVGDGAIAAEEAAAFLLEEMGQGGTQRK